MKKIVDLISSSLFFDATAILRNFRIFMQLKTFDDISFMISNLSKNRYIENKKKSIFSFLFSNSKFLFIFHLIVSSIKLINLIDSINNKNVIQRRKKKKKILEIDFDQLIKTDQISLNVIKNKFEKKLLFADLNTVNIIEKKTNLSIQFHICKCSLNQFYRNKKIKIFRQLCDIFHCIHDQN